MINKLFLILSKFIVSSILIYSFNMLVSSLNFFIPINFVNIFIVSVFDFFGLICLVLFSFTF